MTVRTRFAPSPTGYMHVGNLRTALYAYLKAKSEGGTFILRIEDTDQVRQVEGAVDIIYNTLRQTGLLWDEGPDIGGPVGPYVQSERMGMFKQYAEQLVKAGQAYYCFCTPERLEEMRQEQLAKGASATRYDGHCRDLPPEEVQRLLDAGTPYVIRQKMPREGTTGFDDAVYGHIEVDNSDAGGSDPHQDRRHAHLQLCQRGGRPPDGHHPRDPRLGVSVQHAQVQPAVPGLRLGSADLYPLPARDEGRTA